MVSWVVCLIQVKGLEVKGEDRLQKQSGYTAPPSQVKIVASSRHRLQLEQKYIWQNSRSIYVFSSKDPCTSSQDLNCLVLD